MKRLFLSVFLLYALAWAGALKDLSFEQAYLNQGEKLLAANPDVKEWCDDDHYYQEKDGKLFKVAAATAKAVPVLDPDRYKDVLGANAPGLLAAERTKDLNRFLFVTEGDIYLFSRAEGKNGKYERLTHTEGVEENPKFSPDGRKLAYTRAGNLYVYDIASGQTTALTQDGSESILNGYASWIYYEEILGRQSRYRAFWWSPDSKKIVFMRFDQGRVPEFPIFNADGVYGTLEKQRYPKPGFPNPQVKIGVIDLDNKKGVEWPGDSGDDYLAFPVFNDGGDTIYFQWLNRGQDHLKVLAYNLVSRRIDLVYEEKQPCWVEFFETGSFYPLKDGRLLLRSGKDGWYHLYLIDKNRREKQLTPGPWSVSAIDYVDQQAQMIYFSARKEDSTRTDFYRLGFRGRQPERLTGFNGSHRVDVSPAGKYFIDRYSSIQTPERMDLRDKRGKLVRKMGDAGSPVLKTYKLARVELFRIQTADGYALPARWYLPADLDSNRKYPVVFSIYGGPGAARVADDFGSLRHHFLANQGIIVLLVDHRGSGHFGKKGIDLMHRCLGKWEMHDYGEAVKYLRRLPFVDAEKIGITGGSYGGYVVGLALTQGAGYFKYGNAGFSVIDWRLYDSVYTEKYMDTPQENPAGYEKSSVLSYIDQYRDGSLRIEHGSMDDNVHLQNTLQFVAKALDSGKILEMMIYPGDRHGNSARSRKDAFRAEIDFWFRKFFNKEFKINKQEVKTP